MPTTRLRAKERRYIPEQPRRGITAPAYNDSKHDEAAQSRECAKYCTLRAEQRAKNTVQ
uniref:Uncharacterized protein n=1 Tax=Siphoviridae sp. cttDR14 TaxID=2826490 RepID=A0A8S5M2K8_9CAUD|nr:MAG TPA: hypothetical protein [Siphoviridae sp. cttDR14]